MSDTDQLVTDEDEGLDLEGLANDLFNEPAAPDADELDPADDEQPSDDPTPGQPRDESGKFAPKTGNPPAPAGTPAPPPAPPATPFRFRSVGQEIPLDGATMTPTGDLVISKSALPQVQQLLARGHEQATVGRQREQQYQREIAQAKAAAGRPTEETIRANVVATELAKVLDSDEEMARFLENPQQYREHLRLRVENSLYKRTSEFQKEQQSSVSQIEQEQQLSQAQETEVPAMIRELAEHPSLKGKLTDADIQAAEEHFSGFKGQLIRKATRDEAVSLGVPEGSLIRVQTPVFQLLTRLAGIRDEHKAASAAMAKAAKSNAALNAKPKGPPVGGQSGRTSSGTAKKLSPQEAKRAVLDMKYEDLED